MNALRRVFREIIFTIYFWIFVIAVLYILIASISRLFIAEGYIHALQKHATNGDVSLRELVDEVRFNEDLQRIRNVGISNLADGAISTAKATDLSETLSGVINAGVGISKIIDSKDLASAPGLLEEIKTVSIDEAATNRPLSFGMIADAIQPWRNGKAPMSSVDMNCDSSGLGLAFGTVQCEFGNKNFIFKFETRAGFLFSIISAFNAPRNEMSTLKEIAPIVGIRLR